MSVARTVGKTAAWCVAGLLLISAAAVVAALNFDWNRLKPWVAQQASTALGRPVAINGQLTLGWRPPQGETGWRTWVPWPNLSATQVAVGNPDWAKAPNFATLDALRVEVAVLPLLAHQVVIPSIELVRPAIDLERLADGRNTWTFTPKSSGQPSAWHVQLRDIAFATGTVTYRDAITHADLQVRVDTLGKAIPLGDALREQEQVSRAASAQRVGRKGAAQLTAKAESQLRAASGASGATASAASAASGVSAAAAAAPASGTAAAPAGPSYAFGLTVKGRYKNVPIDGTGKLGGVLALGDRSRPFPLQADIQAGGTRLALVGTLTDPQHLAALDLRMWLQGQSMGQLYALSGVTLPETPPYATEGRLIGRFRHHASEFTYQDFNGRVGGSDLHGTLNYAQREPRPRLSGALSSNLLQFSDLAPIIGADSAASRKARGDTTAQPSNRVLPAETFRTDRWRALDADVTFTGHKLVKQGSLPITELTTHVVMQDGALSLEPLSFGVAGGTLATTAHLDGGTTPLKGRFTVSARHLKLKQLFPGQQVMQSALGEINGDASLSATGNSPAALAATLNGDLKALVNNGKISRLLMEAAGLNVANVVYEKLFGGKDVQINCAAVDFTATNGVLDSKLFALDTDDAVIRVDGTVNLRDESMNLNIHPQTKGFRVFSLRSPLYVKGTFKDPSVGVDAGALALRAGAMVGLGLINPLAALIPLIAPSTGRGVPCAQMFAQLNAPPGTLAAARAGKAGK